MSEEHLTPRERRAVRTREAILDAARRIINEQGVDALSIRGIADAIDYSSAGLYEYFDSKEAIIRAVVAQGFERFTRALEGVAPTLSAREYVEGVGMAYINFAIRNPDFFLLMFTTAALTDLYAEEQEGIKDAESAKAKLLQESSFAVLYRAVARCVEEGLFPTRAGYGIFEMSLTLWGHVHGVAMLRVTNFRHMFADFTAIDQTGLELLFHGLCAPRSADSMTGE